MARSGFRTEKDSLGEVEVPQNALYGAQSLRAAQNYPISGKTAHPSLIRAYLRIKAAAATANQACGALSADLATLILQAVEEVFEMPESRWAEMFIVDAYQAGAGTSQNMNINEVLANLANRIAGNPLGSYSPVHPNDHVNRSQSTNDTYPTAMRLAVLEVSSQLVLEFQALAGSFQKKAEAGVGIPKSARTHLQDAVPMRLGQEFSAYVAVLNRCGRWLTQGRDELRELGISGSAAGTGLNVPPGFGPAVVAELSTLTGEKLRLSGNLFEAMQSQSPLSYFSSLLRVSALELTRICNDLRLLASGPMTGLAELQMPEVQPGSSIMPGKVNPSIVEMANQTWFSVLGYDQAIAYCIQAGQLELNVMMPMMTYSAIEAVTVATNALQVLRTRCVDGIEPNVSRLQKYFESTPQTATALSPKLGYEATAKLVKESLNTGKSVIELVREGGLLSEQEIQSLLSLDALTGRA